jgi:hypothetical protein
MGAVWLCRCEDKSGKPRPHSQFTDKSATLAHRLAARQQQSAPLTERIQQWALAQKPLPDSTFRKALKYMLELWNGLTVFLHNPWVPLDNNHVERQMRDVVLGRKNHYGSKSQRGTEVAALFYSLIETAKLRGEDLRLARFGGQRG